MRLLRDFRQSDAPGMKLDEHSLESIQRVIEGANENRGLVALAGEPRRYGASSGGARQPGLAFRPRVPGASAL